jgi:hypothetical protein
MKIYQRKKFPQYFRVHGEFQNLLVSVPELDKKKEPARIEVYQIDGDVPKGVYRRIYPKHPAWNLVVANLLKTPVDMSIVIGVSGW